MPPSENLIKGLSKAFAIDFPRDVFPTPGGPTKHKIGPFGFLTLDCTARYSMILSFTFESPK